MADKPAWLQQPGESDDNFEKFKVYLTLPSDKRSVYAAANYGRPASKRFKGTPPNWGKVAKRWNWEERALAWDGYLLTENPKARSLAQIHASQIRINDLESQRERIAIILDRTLDFIIEQLSQDEPNYELALKMWQHLSKHYGQTIQQLRLEYGEPTSITETTETLRAEDFLAAEEKLRQFRAQWKQSRDNSAEN